MTKPCSICGGRTLEHGRAEVRGKYAAVFLRCENCGFVFVPDPTWLAEAYAEPINQSDTGYVARNLWARDKVHFLIESVLDPDGRFLDYAAGYGLLVRLMRDIGCDFRWFDLYCPNLFARGFEAPLPLTGPFEAVTAFEVFEHLTDPKGELQKISAFTPCLIFSTVLIPDPAPTLADWWYYGLEHGQHIAFHTRKSLETLAGQFGYRFTTNGADLHVFSHKVIPAAMLSQPTSRWQRLWRRLKRKRGRASLTMPDHHFIAEKLMQEQRAKAPTNHGLPPPRGGSR